MARLQRELERRAVVGVDEVQARARVQQQLDDLVLPVAAMSSGVQPCWFWIDSSALWRTSSRTSPSACCSTATQYRVAAGGVLPLRRQRAAREQLLAQPDLAAADGHLSAVRPSGSGLFGLAPACTSASATLTESRASTSSGTPSCTPAASLSAPACSSAPVTATSPPITASRSGVAPSSAISSMFGRTAAAA